MLFGCEFGWEKKVAKAESREQMMNGLVIICPRPVECVLTGQGQEEMKPSAGKSGIRDIPLLYARRIIGYYFTRLFFVVHGGKGALHRLPLV